MYPIPALDPSAGDPRGSTQRREPVSSVPPTPGEEGATSGVWERRGLLGRLSLLREPGGVVEAAAPPRRRSDRQPSLGYR